MKKGHMILCPFLFLALTHCVNKQPPIEEFNLARVALKAARDSEAKRYSPKALALAERYMKQAEKAFEERYYEKSTGYFRKSRYYSERAETVSRLKIFQQGDMVP